MAELFLELLQEEIPARMQPQSSTQLGERLGALLKDLDLDRGSVRTFATPRRLICVVDDVVETQPDRRIERRGPRIDAPQKAKDGFLRGLGDQHYTLGEIDDKKGRFLLAVIEQKGRRTIDLLAEALPDLLRGFSWPKSMRWGDGSQLWVRPLHRINCLFDGDVVDFEFAGVRSASQSTGHRFMAPEPFSFSGFDEYSAMLAQRYVMLDPARRRARIEEQASALAHQHSLTLKPDPGLLNELQGLVEWPVAVLGRIDPDFMDLPDEVLITSMREHQKFLALEEDSGKLAPYFLTIANLQTDDDGQTIVAGNEYVLRARLWDARFFWNQDRGVRLDDRVAALDAMVFHADLGTLGEKAGRLDRLARILAEPLGVDPGDAGRAAWLAKADLLSGMVGEFPELQGIMGGYYARHQGEKPEIADAVADHYRPVGPADRCPDTPLGMTTALADKIDTLIGFFAAGIKPTGSRDPFALRRAALGVIRIVVEHDVRINLQPVFAQAVAGYGDRFSASNAGAELLDFIIDRFRVYLRGAGMRHDIIEATLSGTKHDDLVNLRERVQALGGMLDTGEGRDLLAACKRTMNILAIEEKRDGVVFDPVIDQASLSEPAELELAEQARKMAAAVQTSMDRFDMPAALGALSSIRAPLDRFFDELLVNDPQPDKRQNRLSTLAVIRDAATRIASISMIDDSGHD